MRSVADAIARRCGRDEVSSRPGSFWNELLAEGRLTQRRARSLVAYAERSGRGLMFRLATTTPWSRAIAMSRRCNRPDVVPRVPARRFRVRGITDVTGECTAECAAHGERDRKPTRPSVLDVGARAFSAWWRGRACRTARAGGGRSCARRWWGPDSRRGRRRDEESLSDGDNAVGEQLGILEGGIVTGVDLVLDVVADPRGQPRSEAAVDPSPGDRRGSSRTPRRRSTGRAAGRGRRPAVITIAEMPGRARPREGSSTCVRDRLFLGLLEVGVGAGGVVGDVDDVVDLGDGLGDRYFDALAEGDCGHAAALASAA
jgi:hypothetical protein